jgi:hypothetical protein
VSEVWEPRYPLMGAEVFVDWIGHRDHIVRQRERVERAAAPTAKRLALNVTEFGLPTNTLVAKMEQVLIEALMRSVRFGYREAQREIAAQRAIPSSGRRSLAAASAVRRGEIGNDSLHLRPDTTTTLRMLPERAKAMQEYPGASQPRGNSSTDSDWSPHDSFMVPLRGRREVPRSESILAYTIPDAGKRARLARAGVPGIYGLVRERSRQVAHGIVTAAHEASVAAAATGHDRTGAAILVAKAVTRTLHNSVLELVGESLNLGRTAGALESRPVPEFALRSEQLDKSTCEVCDHEHGEIYPVDSTEFFDHMPPNYCLGAGRCRGIYVFEAGPMPRIA